MEYIDIVDENNILTGEKAERELIHEKGIWHREVAVWIMNEEGKILLQKRAPTKKQSPNKWGLCAGHIGAGETVESAVIRELKEELGVSLSIDDLELMYIKKEQTDFKNGQKNYMFCYVYFFKTNKKISDYKIQKEELSEIKYITFEELKNAIKTQNPDFTFTSQKQANKIVEELDKRMP